MDKFESSDIIKVVSKPYYTLWPKNIIRRQKLKKSIIRHNFFFADELRHIKMAAACFFG
jgi:hypothetical protein